MLPLPRQTKPLSIGSHSPLPPTACFHWHLAKLAVSQQPHGVEAPGSLTHCASDSNSAASPCWFFIAIPQSPHAISCLLPHLRRPGRLAPGQGQAVESKGASELMVIDHRVWSKRSVPSRGPQHLRHLSLSRLLPLSHSTVPSASQKHLVSTFLPPGSFSFIGLTLIMLLFLLGFGPPSLS